MLRDRQDIASGENVSALVSRLVGEARGLASAEVGLVKARVAERVAAYRNAVIFFAIAGVLAFSAFIALLVGLILTIATLVGPGFATAIVVVTCFVVAAVLGIVGKGRLAAPRPDSAA